MLRASCDENQPGQDYWNIDDILAEEENVPVEFKQDARGLAHFDQATSVAASKAQISKMKEQTKDDVLKTGQKIDLPAWLGIELAKRGVVELKKPSFLTQAFFN